MCLILISYKMHPKYKLIVGANRDEFYARPADQASWWTDFPSLLAGRDLKEGGTWMGITKTGKFATVTNYREGVSSKPSVLSRGSLIKDFLTSEISPIEFKQELESNVQRFREYNGFNLIFGDVDHLYYYSNHPQREGHVIELVPGIYGVSNAFLDTGWPKIRKGKLRLEKLLLRADISPESVLEILSDTQIAGDCELPDTGIGIEYERILSPLFIRSSVFGTRSSSFLSVTVNNETTFVEKTFFSGDMNEDCVKTPESPNNCGSDCSCLQEDSIKRFYFTID